MLGGGTSWFPPPFLNINETKSRDKTKMKKLNYMVGRGAGKVKYTKDASKFLTLPEGINRPVVDSHVDQVGTSLDLLGVIKPAIIIRTKAFSKNGKYQLFIGDGQHTITYLKRKGEEIPYIVITLKTKEEIVFLVNKVNNVGKPWRLEDYVNSWATSGKRAYKKLQAYNAQEKLSMTIIATTMADPESTLVRYRKPENIKSGNFKICKEQVGKQILSNLNEIFYSSKALLVPERRITSRFAQYYTKLLKSPVAHKYNHKKFMATVKRNRAHIESALDSEKDKTILALFMKHFGLSKK
jgi:hypothetical protein